MKEFASDHRGLTWVFICPTDGRPVGGNKMIYRSAERLVDLGYKSEVFHPLRRAVRGRTFRIISIFSGKPNPFLRPDSGSRLTWFNTSAKVSQRALDPRKDLLIIPEVMVPDLAPSAIKLGFKYCIFAQNGFLIDSGIGSVSKDRLAYFYTRSQCVLSISESTSELIRLAYPNLDKRIVRVFVDGTKRVPHYDKSNIITYMPRKLALHSRKVLFFLESRLPPGWVIQPIDGLSESEAHSLLARSKFFCHSPS